MSTPSKAPTIAFAGALAASVALLLAWNSDLTFLIDDWEFLLNRRVDLDSLLTPHNEHPSASAILIYRAILHLFGMESPLPFAVASIALFAATVALVYVYARRRVGGWLGFALALPLLFLGAAYEDLLTPFQMTYFGATACGLGALVILDRDESRDVIAATLLCVSLTFSSVGLVFCIAAAAAIWADEGRRAARWAIVAVPLGLWALWWLGWGHEAESFVSLSNLEAGGHYILDGIASSLAALFGLSISPTSITETSLAWGVPLFVGGLVLAGARLVRGTPPDRWIWVSVTALAAFWFLAALNATGERPPAASRYQFVGALWIVLVAAELARGARPGRTATSLVVGLSCLAAIGGVVGLNRGHDRFSRASEIVRGSLAGVETAASTGFRPGFELGPNNAGFQFFGLIPTEAYLQAEQQFGSPAYDEEELIEHPAGATAADRVVADAHGIRLAPPPAPVGRCPVLQGYDPAGTVVPAVAPGLALQPLGTNPLEVQIGRFAEDFPVDVGAVPRGGATLVIPDDASSLPWRASLHGAAGVRLCRSDGDS